MVTSEVEEEVILTVVAEAAIKVGEAVTADKVVEEDTPVEVRTFMQLFLTFLFLSFFDLKEVMKISFFLSFEVDMSIISPYNIFLFPLLVFVDISLFVFFLLDVP